MSTLKELITARQVALVDLRAKVDILKKQVDRCVMLNGAELDILATALSDTIDAADSLDTAVTAVEYPTVEVDTTTYSIHFTEVSYKGTVYSAEDVAADAVLAGEMIDEGVTGFVEEAP